MVRTDRTVRKRVGPTCAADESGRVIALLHQSLRLLRWAVSPTRRERGVCIRERRALTRPEQDSIGRDSYLAPDVLTQTFQ